jgi:hypothetical protein
MDSPHADSNAAWATVKLAGTLDNLAEALAAPPINAMKF